MSPHDSNLASIRTVPEDRPPVLIWHERSDEYAAVLRELLPGVGIETWTSSGRSHGSSRAQVLLTWKLAPGALRHVPSLRWLQIAGAGVDHFLHREDLADDILLTRSLGRFGIQAAEYVVGSLLHQLIGIENYRRDQQAQRWRPRPRPLLADKTVGVIGLGSLGSGVSDRLASLGVRVIGVSRSGEGPASAAEVVPATDWHTILPSCDALVLTAPLTPETHRMVDAEALAGLPEGATLINVARGQLVDAEAVLESLRSGHLGAAFLDVFEQEPLAADDPLWAEPRAVITPHIAGPSEIVPVAREFAANYERFVRSEPLAHPVDRERGY
jgi:phosphoglycerate dehydrogenase-like enzyme